MTTIGDDTLADLVVQVLATGPHTGYEIARALEEKHQVHLRGQEGALYPALVELERGGFVEGVWAHREDGARRRRYHLPVLQDIEPAEDCGGEPEDEEEPRPDDAVEIDASEPAVAEEDEE